MERSVVLLVLLVSAVVASPQRPHLQVDVSKSVVCPEGQKARDGDKVTVHYGGFLMDGKKFDSSFDRNKPFTFDLGVGQVIPGWDQGLLGVCKGEERHLVVPASLAYGDRGAGDVIPPDATLLFDIVIVDVIKAKSAGDLRREQEEEERRRAAVVAEAEAARRREEQEEAERRRLEQDRRLEEDRRRKAEAAEAARKRQQEEDERRRQQELDAQRAQQQQEQQQQQPDYEYEDYPEIKSACPAGSLDTRVQFQPPDCSRKARAGDKLRMHYVGKLLDGTKFDSSIDRNKPFDFTLGVGQVIQGWDAGVLGMCVSEKRTLVVPPDMAYGEAGVGNVIPSCATLVFDVLLLSIDS